MTRLLDVAIGVALLYGSLALFVTTIQELVASLLSARAKRLYAVLEQMLESSVLVRQLYEHPLIKNLTNGKTLPSYIPSRAFAVALVDVLRGTQGATDAIGAGELLAGARSSVEKVAEPELRRVLLLLVGDAERLATTLQERAQLVSERLETWFNDRMARAEGWYKRRAQAWSLGLALAVVASMNVDSIHVVQRLWEDHALRDAAVTAAQTNAAIDTLPLPIGWAQALPTDAVAWALRLVGWLATAIAVSLGATFWFDVLNRLLRLRGTGARVSAATGRVEATALEVAP